MLTVLGISRQRQRRAAHVHTVKVAAAALRSHCRSDAPVMMLYQLGFCAVAVQSGDLPQEGRVDIDHQIAAG